MSRRIQVGDSDQLAVGIEFLSDPDAGEAADSELAATWGALEVWVAGRNLTEHRDPAGGLHGAVRWYLGPLLRWFVRSRDAVHDDLASPIPTVVSRGVEFLGHGLAPEGLSARDQARWEDRAWRWRQRHDLAAARVGGIVPPLVLRRLGDDVEVSWDPDLSPSLDGHRFLEPRGVAFVPLRVHAEFVGELALTLKHLKVGAFDSDVDFPKLPQGSLLTRARRTVPDDCAWLIEDATRHLGPLGLAAQSLDPGMDAADSTAVIDLALRRATTPAVASAPNPPAMTAATSDVGGDCGLGGFRGLAPHEQGYLAALELRERLGLDNQPIGVVEDLLPQLGCQLQDVILRDLGVRAVVLGASARGMLPVVAVNRGSTFNAVASGRRASALQGLGHVLLGATAAGNVGFAHGSGWNHRPSEQRANAFAAMMLAPRDQVMDLTPDLKVLRRRAERLGTSAVLLAWHAHDLDRFTQAEAEMLVAEAAAEAAGSPRPTG